MTTLSQIWYWLLLGVAGSYLIGCFNFAVWISKVKHRDIRRIGSGNPGTMNMFRAFGVKVGLINFFCDAFKGIIPVLVGFFAFRHMTFAGTDFPVSAMAKYLFGLFAVIGHIFPVTMKFKGGKGIATTLGAFLAGLSCEVWWYSLIIVAFFALILLFIALSEWGAVGSLLGVSCLTIWQAVRLATVYQPSKWLTVTLLLLLAFDLFTWGAHHKNLYKLMGGEEHRTSVRKMLKKHSH